MLRSWSDVDVCRSLFHSPLPVDEEEEEKEEEEEEEKKKEEEKAVTGPARSLCAAVTSTGRPPRELCGLSTERTAEPAAHRNWISLPANPSISSQSKIRISPAVVHSGLLFFWQLLSAADGFEL